MKKLYTSPEATINNYEPAEDITASGVTGGIIDGGGNTDPGWGDIID